MLATFVNDITPITARVLPDVTTRTVFVPDVMLWGAPQMWASQVVAPVPALSREPMRAKLVALAPPGSMVTELMFTEGDETEIVTTRYLFEPEVKAGVVKSKEV